MTNYRMLVSSMLLASGLGLAAAPSIAAPRHCERMAAHGDFVPHHAQRMAHDHQALQEVLKLTPDQEGAWTKLMVSEQPMARVEALNPDEWARLTTPERANRMLAAMNEHQLRLTDHVAAIKAFYAVLTPQQQKVFDDFHAVPHAGKPSPHASGMHRSPPKP